ncbi:MAG TPA: RNA polymerase sigma factor [Gemmatimonadales bacterium]|nr:RNA polymerase sigma factor [Gemmatimonadales bacterium]
MPAPEPSIPFANERSDDAALVQRLSTGDLGALDALFHRYASALLNLARRVTGSSVDAEDVVQDLFVGLPMAVRRYAERGSFGAWLRTVTVRLALDRVRRRTRRHEVDLDLAGEQTAVSETPEVRWDIEGAIAALPDDLRMVFVLKEVEGFSHAEIGRLLGIRTGTSEVRLHRAMRALRRALGGGA